MALPWQFQIGWRFIGAVLLVTAFSTPAAADARSEAKMHFDRGMDLIAADRFVEGIEQLERADAILSHPTVRFNIGKAWADAGQLDRAIAAYREYLRTDPSDRNAVEALVVELERRRAREAARRDSERVPPKPTDIVAKTNAYEERIITASRREQGPLDAPSSTSVVTRQDIRLSGITRVPELLRRVAGMDVMQMTGGDTNVSMRGLNSRLSNKLLVLVDGRSVKNDILGSTFWESLTIDVDQIERIEIVRGPGSALYGADASAGVVNIITRRPSEGNAGLRVGGGDGPSAYASLWTTGREGNFAYRASAGFTRYPRWTREVGPNRVDVTQTDVNPLLGAQNARLRLALEKRIAERQSLEVTGGFARSVVDFYGIGPFNDYLAEMDYAYGDARYRLGSWAFRLHYAHLAASASASAAHVGRSMYETDPRQHRFGSDAQFAQRVFGPASVRHDITVGVGYRLKRVRWNYLSSTTPFEHHVGIFAQEALQLANAYDLVLAGRLDYVPSINNVVPSARASFIARPTESAKQAIRASFATAFRSPSFLESYLDLPIELPLGGLEMISASARDDDPNFRLDPENILATEIGYTNRELDALHVEVAGYYHRISGTIALAPPRPLSLTDVAAGLGSVNPETGRFRVAGGGWLNKCERDHVVGGEFGLRWQGVAGLDVFANYALNHKWIERPEGCLSLSDQPTSRHKINAGIQLRTSFGLESEVFGHYQTQQSWVEQVATLDGITDRRFELPGYHLLNGSLGYGFLRRRRARVQVVVYNALAGLLQPAPQMHPFGNRISRRIMGFFSYGL